MSVCSVKVQLDTNHALEVMPGELGDEDEEEDEVEVGHLLVSRASPS